MDVNSKTRRSIIPGVALGILGLPVGVILWFFVLYITALFVGQWKETHFRLVQAAFVLVEIAVIVGLMLASIRTRQGRGFLVGVFFSFATVTLLFWTGWVP